MLELMENARNVQFIHLLLKIIQNAFVIIPTNGIIKLIDAKGWNVDPILVLSTLREAINVNAIRDILSTMGNVKRE